MFHAIGVAGAEIFKAVGDRSADLDLITRVVEGVTAIDKAVFVEFESTPANPVLGAFQK